MIKYYNKPIYIKRYILDSLLFRQKKVHLCLKQKDRLKNIDYQFQRHLFFVKLFVKLCQSSLAK